MNMFWDKCVGCNITSIKHKKKREDCIDFGLFIFYSLKLSELGLFLNFSSIVEVFVCKISTESYCKTFNNYSCSFDFEV
jgi:hypothetical protein